MPFDASRNASAWLLLEFQLNTTLLHEFQLLNGEVFDWNNQINIDCDLIIDGIFGIGINRNVEGEFLQVINTINKSKAPVLSLDIPSGLNADTGEVMGSSIKADVTSTFVGRKKGLYLKQGPLISGCIEFSNLSIPDKCFKNAKIEFKQFKERIKG